MIKYLDVKAVHTFLKLISPKVKSIALLEFELVFYNMASSAS